VYAPGPSCASCSVICSSTMPASSTRFGP
jgi:hypothetical protein